MTHTEPLTSCEGARNVTEKEKVAWMLLVVNLPEYIDSPLAYR
jgi:hypothetical protein